MSPSAFLSGHLIAELAAAVLALAVLSVSGLIVGWRIHADLAHTVGGFGLLLLFAFAMLWVGTLLGVAARSPDAVTGITFVSNAFVPAGGLPDGLRAMAEWNPVSAVVAGVRTLFGNPTALPSDAAWPLQHPVLSAVGWCLLVLAVAVPLTLRRYRARTTG
jgi:ABC-2 type transport system permease protein